MNQAVEVLDAEILKARTTRYFGYSDSTTEQALAWCLPKHPHPLNLIHSNCHWCLVERKCFEIGHPATRACDTLWWNGLVGQMNAERGAYSLSGKGFTFSFVRINHPDGRWWVSIVIDSALHADFSGLSVSARTRVEALENIK